MSEAGNEDRSRLTLKIPVIKAESETQTSGHLVSRTPEETPVEMESTDQKMSIRKRRNISKNRGQATRHREKTPEPGRMGIPQDETTTSDDEDFKPQRNSREIEADSTYEEMKRLVQEKSTVKDPIYDLNIDEVLEARATAAHERRRRSISPFAVPDEECKLEHKGSFTDPKTKLLSTSYTLSPKDEDTSRRNSLTIETPKEAQSSLSPPTPTSASPKDKNAPCLIPSTPKKLEEIIYPDEVQERESIDEACKKLKTPVTKESVFTFEEKDIKTITKVASTKNLETATSPGELVTKVIQIERTPSKKLSQDNRPVVELREGREIRTRIVRTPSRKLSADIKPVLKPQPKPVAKEEPQSKSPPVKPARSKSATRFGNKTSESEMSEDQQNQQTIVAAPRRRVVPTPRRFIKNRSPRTNRSQSVARVEEVKVIDRTGSELSQTSLEIVELMQKARARSLSIPKDDPRLPVVYKNYNRNLQTPNKTPSTPRRTREISCPKTIQIISDLEILAGLSTNKRVELENEKRSRQSSGYIDASQSEYTSSCCSSSPSENEYDFDLSERTAELTRKLNLLSQEVDKRETKNKTASGKDDESKQETEPKSVLRKRSVVDAKNGVKKERKKSTEDKTNKNEDDDKKKKPVKSKWKLIANWQQFKQENKRDYNKIILLRNQCISETLLLIIMCGLGGMMFKSFEGSFENAYKCGTRNVKRDFIESLWRGSHYLREEDWKSMARTKLYDFENQLHNAHEAGVTSFSGQRSWSFINSFVYCLTLVTTIGYGHIAPKTTYGRIATIIYAIIGIPLFLIVLADFGKLFTRIIKYFWAFIRRFYYTRNCRKVRRTETVMTVMKGLNTVCEAVRRPSQIFTEEDIEEDDVDLPPHPEKPGDEPPPLPPKPGVIIRDVETGTEPETPAPSVYQIDDEFNLPISVAIVILVMYIVIGAVIFKYFEQWEFFESFYFVFISMSTIGLGDFVPSRPVYMMVTMLYLVFGLALTSMCINVVQVKLSDTFKQASAKLSATIGLNTWSNEEDGVLDVKTSPSIEIAPVHKPKSEKEEIKSKENNENDPKND